MLLASRVPAILRTSFTHAHRALATMSEPVKHVIFDMDGLLLDTEGTYTKITNRVTGQFGKEFTWELKKQVMGRASRNSAEHVIKTLELPIDVDDYLAQMQHHANELFPDTPLLPGVERLVRHLKANNVPIAVATSSSTPMYNLKTQNHKEVFDLFDVIVRGDDPAVKHSKPAPDIFLEAASRLQGAPASGCLVFEDSPLGCEAAVAAGMRVIAVPDPRADMDMFKNATSILRNTLTEFNPAEYGLPPF